MLALPVALNDGELLDVVVAELAALEEGEPLHEAEALPIPLDDGVLVMVARALRVALDDGKPLPVATLLRVRLGEGHGLSVAAALLAALGDCVLLLMAVFDRDGDAAEELLPRALREIEREAVMEPLAEALKQGAEEGVTQVEDCALVVAPALNVCVLLVVKNATVDVAPRLPSPLTLALLELERLCVADTVAGESEP